MICLIDFIDCDSCSLCPIDDNIIMSDRDLKRVHKKLFSFRFFNTF